MLEIKDLRAGYAGVEILRGIDLSVNQGEIVAVLGSNGVGKSTLNNNISALYKPYNGSIRFAGEEICGLSSMQIVDRGLIHVPEGRKIFPNLNVLENLEMGSVRRGRKNRAKNLEKVFSVFPRLKERITQSAGTMSGGEQQMLAIGRGLMSEPLLLILDEPSLGLSPLMVKEMFLLIRQLNLQGQSILLMEQNAVQTLAISNRAYIIENGLVPLSGKSSDLASDPDLKKRYLGL
jgi:branched-chain amino acid transport system ATP-binding protein